MIYRFFKRLTDIAVSLIAIIVFGPLMLVLAALIKLGSPGPVFYRGVGILGVTLLWDALEFYRQQRRIQRGHAPANPNNPRHAKILAEFPSATTIDWLDRDPRGSAYASTELASIKEAGQ